MLAQCAATSTTPNKQPTPSRYQLERFLRDGPATELSPPNKRLTPIDLPLPEPSKLDPIVLTPLVLLRNNTNLGRTNVFITTNGRAW